MDAGLYALVHVASGYAMDVTGGSDRAGTAVKLWPYNGRDAQAAMLAPDSGYTSVLFPLTGKVLDVPNSQASAGAELATWDAHGGLNQQFSAVDAGTATVGGATRQCVRLASRLDPSLYVGAVSTAQGAAVCLRSATDNTTRWALVPLGAVLDGTYRVLSAMDQSVMLDVTGGSLAMGANLELWTENDGTQNNQVFRVRQNQDGSVGLLVAATGYAVDAANGDVQTPTSGTNLVVWRDKGSTNQKYALLPEGTVERNGSQVPAYRLTCQAGSSLCVDACGAATRPGTNVWLWSRIAGAPQQLWVLVPAEAYASGLPVASALAHDAGVEPAQVCALEAGASHTLNPSWAGVAGAWQLRYRTRTRDEGMADADRSAWSAWSSVLDGSTSNDGWGEAWSANCDVTVDGPRSRSVRGVACDLDTHDLVEVEYQVRSFQQSWGPAQAPAHGGSASAVCRAAVAPGASVPAVSWTPDGLIVQVTGSFARGGNSWRADVYGVRDGARATLVEGLSATGAPHDCALVAPTSDLSWVPGDGEALAVEWSLVTCDGAEASGYEAVECSYGTGHGGTLEPTVAWDADVRALVLGLGAHEASSAWLVHPRGLVELDVGPDGACRAIYPFGEPFDVFAMAVDGGAWATWHASYQAILCGSHALDWDGGHLEVEAGHDQPPSVQQTVETDSETSLVLGRDWESAWVGRGRGGRVTVSGVLEGDGAGTWLDFTACRFCWWRSPFGDVARCAVLSVDSTRTYRGIDEVSVQLAVTDR